MDNTQQAKAWLEYANADLDAAGRLLKSPKPNSWTFLLSAWHCHQAIEKILKMVIISQAKENLKIHDLLKLAELTGLEFTEPQINFLKSLNQYYSHSRYPDMIYEPLPQLTPIQAETQLKTAQDLSLWLNQQIQN